MTSRPILLALPIAALAVSACTAKQSAPAESPAAAKAITVNATDSACTVSVADAKPGTTTFSVTNNGTKVTEFYVYGKGDKVLAEVENISPGLQRELSVDFTEAGTYRLACKPGMVGDGIRADFVVK